jgi:hypothetical protein
VMSPQRNRATHQFLPGVPQPLLVHCLSGPMLLHQPLLRLQLWVCLTSD